MQLFGLIKLSGDRRNQMPMVNGKKYAYTKAGKAAAKKAQAKKKKPKKRK